MAFSPPVDEGALALGAAELEIAVESEELEEERRVPVPLSRVSSITETLQMGIGDVESGAMLTPLDVLTVPVCHVGRL